MHLVGPRIPRAIVLLTFVASFPTVLGSRRPQEDPKPFDAIRSALALVGRSFPTEQGIGLSWLGTGFVVDSKCTVLTAKHIFENADRQSLMVRVTHPEDRGRVLTLPARTLYEDPQRDLMWLRVAGLPGEGCMLERLQGLVLADAAEREALAGEPVMLGGFPVLEGSQPRDVPILRQGFVASAELEWDGRAMLLLDLTGVPGFSGAPVIRKRDARVIGVVLGPGLTARQYDLNWATPVSHEDYRRALSDAT